MSGAQREIDARSVPQHLPQRISRPKQPNQIDGASSCSPPCELTVLGERTAPSRSAKLARGNMLVIELQSAARCVAWLSVAAQEADRNQLQRNVSANPMRE